MTMKKILAGVLAAASAMAISTSAFAVEAPDKTKAVTKPGETEYEAGVTLMGAELDVELPAQMKAFLNPYGATVSVNEDKDVTKIMKTKNGIVSWGYEIVNNTQDFGIYVDVKDLKGKMTSKDGSLKDAAPTAGSKEAWIAMVGGKDAATATGAAATAPAAISAVIAKAATTDNTGKQTCLPVKADGSADSASKFVYCQAKDKDGANTMTKGVIAFTGILAKSTSTSTVEWTEDDEITLTYTLKISPAPAVAVAADFT